MEKKYLIPLIIGGIFLVFIFFVSGGYEEVFQRLDSEQLEGILSHSEESPIGYEYLDSETLHFWNNYDDYYLNMSSGIQFSNFYNEYWTHNIWCAGYKTASWNYLCADTLPIQMNVESDNLTYVKIEGLKNISIGGKLVQVTLTYSLKLNDIELNVTPQMKNVGTSDISVPLAFAWRTNEININGNPQDDLVWINNTMYPLNGSIDLLFTNMTIPRTQYDVEYNLTCESSCGGNETCEDECTTSTPYTTYDPIPFYRIHDENFIKLRWNPNLDYFVQVKNKTGQDNAPITLAIKTTGLNVGQTKQTSFFWRDPVSVTVGDIKSANDSMVASYTATTGKNRLLVLALGNEGGTSTQKQASSVTFGGTAMTKVHLSKIGESTIEYWVLEDSSIREGSLSFGVTWTPSSPTGGWHSVAFTFLGVNQDDPISNTTNITSALKNSLTDLITPITGGYVVSGVNQARPGTTTWVGTIERSEHSASSSAHSYSTNESVTATEVIANATVSGALDRDMLVASISLAPFNYTFDACAGGTCIFDYHYIEEDIEYSESGAAPHGDSGVEIKFNVTALCDLNPTITNTANLSFYITAKTGTPDSDARAFYVNNVTWKEGDSAASINGHTEQNTTTTRLSSTTANTFTNISVTPIASRACEDGGNNTLTIRVEDIDSIVGTIAGVTDTTTYNFGVDALFSPPDAFYTFASRENSNKTRRPKLYINYSTDLVGGVITVNVTTPFNDTYNATVGNNNVSCAVTSTTTITNATIVVDKYYGGWNVNDEYFSLSFNSSNLTSTFGSNTNFNMSSLVNFTNGFYRIYCIATDSANTTIASKVEYKTGVGRVLIHHAVHTEPDLNDTNLGTFSNDLDNASITGEMEAFRDEPGNELYDAFNQTWRNLYYDSYGTNTTFSWDYRMDELACESVQGCNLIFDAMIPFEDNITQFNDGKGWHYHHMDWYNYTEWEDDEDGIATLGETGDCPSGGCQPAAYWNQITEFDNTTFRDINSTAMTEKMLSIFIIESGVYPISYVSGWLWENENFSNWVDDIIPFTYNNYYGLGPNQDGTGQPIEGVLDWGLAPETAYNPDPDNLLTAGNNSRIIIPCKAGYSYDLMNKSFELASNGTDVILCYYDHSYSSVKDNVVKYHDCINETAWGTCANDDMVSLYPNVTWQYGDDLTLVQEFLDKDDTIPPNLSIMTSGDWTFINSTEELWKPPLLAIQNSTNFYFRRGTPNGTLQWKVNISDYNPLNLRAAGVDTSYNAGSSDLAISSITLLSPTTASPSSVADGEKITAEFQFFAIGVEQTSGVKVINITVNSTAGCTLVDSLIYSVDRWKQNCTLPSSGFNQTGLQDLTINANHTTTDTITQIETSSLNYGSPNCWDYVVAQKLLKVPSGCLFIGSPTGTLFKV